MGCARSRPRFRSWHSYENQRDPAITPSFKGLTTLMPGPERAYIDSEEPRIGNGLERVRGTYGWVVICP